MFIGVNVLKSHTLSNLNRDEAGMPKTFVYGGTQRLRQSSQNVKKTLRDSELFHDLLMSSSLAGTILEGAKSLRTRKLSTALAETDAFREHCPEDLADDFITAFASIYDTSELLVYSRSEFDAIVEKVCAWLDEHDHDAVAAILAEYAKVVDVKPKGKSKTNNKKNSDEAGDAVKATGFYQDFVGIFASVLNCGMTLDIALFGRMLAEKKKIKISEKESAKARVDGAVRVGHFFTTNASEIESDFFTAMDDYVELGAGHMNYNDFGSGCFYGFVGLCCDELLANVARYDVDKDLLIHDVTRCIVQQLMCESSHSKQTSMASMPSASTVLVEVYEDNIGFDHSKAFENAVRNFGQGYAHESTKRLIQDVERCAKMYDVIPVKRYLLTEFEDLALPDSVGVNCQSMSELFNLI